MFITRMSLPRRTLLKGVGATLALPFLDAMVPALTPAPEGGGRPAPRRVHLLLERHGDRALDAGHDRQGRRRIRPSSSRSSRTAHRRWW